MARRRPRYLLWYPQAWQRRYGHELMALMEDNHPNGRVPWRRRLEVARAGSTERLHAWGVFGPAPDPVRGIRAGSVLVLWAWAAFVVAGTAFAKMSEHWQPAVPANSQFWPNAGFWAVVGAAVAGLTAFATAGAVCAAPLWGLLRQGGWRAAGRPLYLAVTLSSVVAVALVALSRWAHHLSDAQRNGADGLYSAVVLMFAALTVSALAFWCVTAARLFAQVELSARQVRLCGRLALVVFGLMLVITAGVAAWLSAMAVRAPQFLFGGTPGHVAGGVPPNLATVAVIMVAGLAVGVAGAHRALVSLRSMP